MRPLGRTLRAGLVAASLSGAPSTVHALATERDPLEATYAAGSLLLPEERRPAPLGPQVADHVAFGVVVAALLDA